tara:strand:- start:284 stop:1084 length:801 start_codon:yes stop_codon:yes gene_type:complete
MKKINLNDGSSIYCIKETEAIVLDEHIKGYLDFDIDIKQYDTIIDVGANIGVLGVRLSQEFQNINLHCFEPIPEIYKVLKKNAEISHNANFKTYMMGLSNVNKLLNFTYYPNSPALSTSQPEIWKNDQENFKSAVEGNIANMPSKLWWTKLIPKFITPLIAKYLTANSQKVNSKVITLSEFIEKEKLQKIDLLKIDCEGEEVNVLRGIHEKHWQLIEVVIMEVNDIENNLAAAKNILSQHGFKNIRLEKEKGFENTKLTNICAKKH